jgi:transcriptional regulator with XRE-family HTH domain
LAPLYNSSALYPFPMPSKILSKFGQKVREERQKQGLSQEDLAEKAGVHRTYIGMIERAEKNITLINIEKIANALGIPIDELLKGINRK